MNVFKYVKIIFINEKEENKKLIFCKGFYVLYFLQFLIFKKLLNCTWVGRMHRKHLC